jgi:hypothetical protein
VALTRRQQMKAGMHASTAQTALAVPSRARQGLILRIILIVALALSILYALYVLERGLFQPLLDQYFSRQTQTALTAYWLLRGSPILAYQTPVVGYPWSIPFEFPTFQIVAAALSLTGLPLDASGRAVSFAFFLGCLWPLHSLFRTLRFSTFAFLFTAILFVLSPFYLYWGRTFMIESCALFFALAWLALFAGYLREPALQFLFGAIAAGSLAVVTKITTFPAFLVLGGILFLRELHAAWTKRFPTDTIRLLALALLAVVIPLAFGAWWTLYSDDVKTHNEFGALLTSQALMPWNLGTLAQRLDWTNWWDAFFARTFTNSFGRAAIFAAIVMCAALLRRQYAYAALGALLAFVIPFLLFTKLHIVHTYYQTANAIFMIAAVGLGLASLAELKHRWIALASLAAIGAGQLAYFDSTYAVYLTGDFSGDRFFRIANIARSATPPAASLIVFGEDWSSVSPYYAQRKSFVIADWMPVPLLKRVLANPQSYLDGAPLGGIIFCADTAAPNDSERRPLIADFVAHRAVLGEAGDCQLLAPAKTQP